MLDSASFQAEKRYENQEITMKHALIVATVGSFITSFEKNDIKILQQMGYQVHVACDISEKKQELEALGVTLHPIPFARSPFSRKNLMAYRALKQVMEETTFSLVHCHTPVGGVLARLVAGRYRKSGCKVIYTAHGFHFFKGASKKNWLIFYTVEKLFAGRTDVLITINREDYERAVRKFRAKQVEYIPGVGLDLERFQKQKNREVARAELAWEATDIYLLSVGELIARKNHELVLRAMKELNHPKLHYVIAGKGPLEGQLKEWIAQWKLEGQVELLGQRNDIPRLCEAADIFVFPSKQEGLPVALMEAMAMELPCVASRIRGNVDLLADNAGGMLCDLSDVHAFAQAIAKLASDEELRRTLGEANGRRIVDFSLEVVDARMREIYQNIAK